MKIMVAGITGYIGGTVARALKANGYYVRGLARNPAKVKIPEQADEVFKGEATQAGTLKGLCDGMDAAFSSIGVHDLSQRKPSIWDVDYAANINIVNEAKRAGVKHFVFVSTAGGPAMAKSCGIAEAREKVAQAVVDSGMAYTIYRPTGFFNDMAYVFNGVAKKHKANIYGNPDVKMNPLNGLDFGDEIAKNLGDPRYRNAYRQIGGPDIFTRRQITRMAFQSLDLPELISYKPIWQFQLLTNLMRPFNYNLFALFRFMCFAFTTPDMTGEPVGHRHLRDYFDELAAKVIAGEPAGH
jgi:uncharacterized protein YbjT (DUF2867 family)